MGVPTEDLVARLIRLFGVKNQAALARELGVYEGSITRWKQGVDRPSFALMLRIAAAGQERGLCFEDIFGDDAEAPGEADLGAAGIPTPLTEGEDVPEGVA